MNEIKIPVLFCQKNSNYKNLQGFDPYDIDRDARTYTGNMPVIAHPPCATWARLRAFAKQDTHDLGFFAIDTVMRCGGIIEHPAGSKLFDHVDLAKGFLLSINQHWFGHPAKKHTWLYIYGVSPSQLPPYPLSFDAISAKVENMSRHHRDHTPILLCTWLRNVALSCRLA